MKLFYIICICSFIKFAKSKHKYYKSYLQGLPDINERVADNVIKFVESTHFLHKHSVHTLVVLCGIPRKENIKMLESFPQKGFSMRYACYIMSNHGKNIETRSLFSFHCLVILFLLFRLENVFPKACLIGLHHILSP